MLKTFTCFILFTILGSFGFQNNEKTFRELFRFFEGKWQTENADIFEIWIFNDSVLEGKVVKVNNEDTLVLERLRIMKIKDHYFYEATVPNQNDGQPVLFKLVSRSQKEFHFENKNHDFPKNIIYTFIDEKNISIKLSGEGKVVTFEYSKLD